MSLEKEINNSTWTFPLETPLGEFSVVDCGEAPGIVYATGTPADEGVQDGEQRSQSRHPVTETAGVSEDIWSGGGRLQDGEQPSCGYWTGCLAEKAPDLFPGTPEGDRC